LSVARKSSSTLAAAAESSRPPRPVGDHGKVDQRAQLQRADAEPAAGGETGAEGLAGAVEVSDAGIPQTEVHRRFVDVLLVTRLAGGPHGQPPQIGRLGHPALVPGDEAEGIVGPRE
jgi:hypothetical protein